MSRRCGGGAMRISSQILVVALLCFAGEESAAAPEKSGVAPAVLSLPSGPGSISGLGESFEPRLNTGTSSYNVKLVVPPGRNGFAPDVVLSYNSGFGNGVAGAGWRLSIPYIQRKTDKGMPYYTDWPVGDGKDNNGDGQVDEFDEFDTYIYVGAEAEGEEFVPVAPGQFRLEIEGAFLRLQRVQDSWVVQRPDGTTLKFGTTAQTRVQDAPGRTFRWHLEQMADSRGNVINFQYQRLDASAPVYLTAIDYNPSGTTGMKVEVLYELRPDVVTDHRAGFEIKTAYRIAGVRMSAAGQIARSYRFTYHPFGVNQPLSLLAAVTEIGRDNISALPPMAFDYVAFNVTGATAITMPTAPSLSLLDSNIDVADLNADGLPDILDTRSALSSPHAYVLNQGPDSNGMPRWGPVTRMQTLTPKLLASSDTQLADIDGDGQADLLDKFGSQSRYYRINNATLNWEVAGNISQPLFDLTDPNTRLLDVNNDKRTDVMRTYGGSHYVWLNLNGSRWSKGFAVLSPNPLIAFSSASTKLADMNGDGLVDLVQLQDGLCRYYPSIGFGNFGPAIVMDGAPTGIINGANVHVMDINGDGRSDVVYVSGSRAMVWTNLGLRTTNHSRGQFALPVIVNGPYTSSGTTAFRVADINGNGSVDLLWNTLGSGAPAFAFIDFAPNEQPYQLKTIKNGIGATTVLSYRSIAQEMVRDRAAARPWSKGVPLQFQVVTQTESKNGFDAQNHVNQYSYHEGYYDGLEREFRGFAAAESKALGDDTQGTPSLITAQRFDTGATAKALKGKLLVEETRNDAGEIFWRDEYTWETRVLIPGQTGDRRSVIFPAKIARIRTVIEKGNGLPVQLQWNFDYDGYGNTTQIVEHGRLDGAMWNDERVTRSVYSAAYGSGRSAWILNRLVEQKMLDSAGRVFAKRQLFYDDETFAGANLGEVGKGDLTMVREWYDPASPTAFVSSARNRYDAWGNVTSKFGPLWGMTPGHATSIVYDEAFQTFPVRESINTGNSTLIAEAGYDAGFGVITQATDFNGNSTAYGYDAHGRLVAIVKPGDDGFNPTTSYGYVLGHRLPDGRVVNWIETRQREQSGAFGTVDSRSYLDGFQRKIMTRAEGETPGQIVVSGSVTYNARRSPHKEYLPYFDTGTLAYQDAAIGDTGFVQNQYDALGRIVRVVQPRTTVSMPPAYSEIIYAPLTKTIKDEEQTNPASARYGSAKQHSFDGLLNNDGEGRLRQTGEWVKLTDIGTPGPLAAWTTRYSYDVLGNLISLEDAQGNIRTSTYDGLSREVFSSDPDRGRTTYGYDAAGHLAYSVDAKGQEIVFQYDGADRVTGEYYIPSPRSNVGAVPLREPDVAYHYDHPQGLIGADRLLAQNTLGRLAWVRDLSGAVHHSYDARGRLGWQAKQFGSGAGASSYFVTRNAYDAMDRPTVLTYPDGARVSYTYNTRGLLGSIGNVVPALRYTATGQLAQMQLAAGTVTHYERDARLRLTRAVTTRSDGLVLQDMNYSFDDVSNINAITDGRSDAHLDQIGAELGINSSSARKYRSTESYAYDDLYRLTGMANAAGESVGYRYDRIGNLLAQTSATIAPADFGAMRYGGSATGQNNGAWYRGGRQAADPPGPHALSGTAKGGIGGAALSPTYDANGSIVALDQKQLHWDHKNRLVKVTSPEATADYVYDHDNIRKIKTVTKTATNARETDWYIDKFSELRAGRLVKYVYAGNDRVARSAQDGKVVIDFAADNYYLAQYTGSTALTLKPNGQVAEAISYLPYGDVRYSSAATLGAKSNTPYAFAGNERDQESGLNYFEQRHLSASLGRFVSTDPVTVTADRLLDPQLLNPYAYARNNPYRYVDPDGRLVFLIPAIIWGAGAAWTAYDTYTTYQTEGAAAAAKALAVDAVVTAAGGAVAKGAVRAGKAAVDYFRRAENVVGDVADVSKVVETAGDTAKNAPEITKAYKRPSGATTVEQRASVQGKPCVDCGAITPKQVADHKTPLVKEYYETGTIDTTRMRNVDAVQPQCPTCSARQGAEMSRYSQQMKKDLDLE